MSTQPQTPFEEGPYDDKKDLHTGESPVNELNDNATVTSSKDDTLSFEQQQGVTRIEALCRSRVPALIPVVLTPYPRPCIRKGMEVLGTLGVSLAGIGEGRRSSSAFRTIMLVFYAYSLSSNTSYICKSFTIVTLQLDPDGSLQTNHSRHLASSNTPSSVRSVSSRTSSQALQSHSSARYAPPFSESSLATDPA